jgi:hypothetical protein
MYGFVLAAASIGVICVCAPIKTPASRHIPAASTQEVAMPKAPPGAPSRLGAGIVANWDDLPGALRRELPSLSMAERRPGSSFSRRWALTTADRRCYRLEIFVYRSATELVGQLHPTNFGGVESQRPIGDRMIEVGFDGYLPLSLLWERKNVSVHLAEDENENEAEQARGAAGSLTDRIARLRALGDSVERFLDSHVVDELASHVPRLGVLDPVPARVQLGHPLKLRVEVAQIRAEDSRLDGSAVEDMGARLVDKLVIIDPRHVGPLHIQLALTNRRTLLGSQRFDTKTVVVTSLDRPLRETRDQMLLDCAIELGPPLRLVRREAGERRFVVHVLALDEGRLLVLTHSTLTASNAPAALVTRLDQALLLGPRGADRLDPATVDLAVRFDLSLSGVVTVAGHDWTVEAGTPRATDPQTREQLRALGVTVDASPEP